MNLNAAAFDGHKQDGLALVGDARAGIAALTGRTGRPPGRAGYEDEYGARQGALGRLSVDAAYAGAGRARRPTQTQVLGALDAVVGDDDVLINAAGSLPGDLHKLWRARGPRQYHLEYGYSCMGYEIPAGIGVRLAAPDRRCSPWSATALPDDAHRDRHRRPGGHPVNLVILQNHGYASIGGLSRQVGAEGFGTAYRFRAGDGSTPAPLPVDLAANAASLGLEVFRAATARELRDALAAARPPPRATASTSRPTPRPRAASGAQAWWDVPVAEVSSGRPPGGPGGVRPVRR